MSIVPNEPCLRYIDGDTWKLTRPFRAKSDVAKGWIRVEAGFITDFNSVPRILTNILPRESYGEAAILHDALYRAGTYNGKPIDQEFADRVHREFVIWKGAPRWKVWAMFRGLRLFGFAAWNRYRRAEKPAPEPAA